MIVMRNAMGRSLLLIIIVLYTAFATGPFLWVSMMSFRKTSEIMANPYAWPEVWHWEKYPRAWFESSYGIYFQNSVVVCVVAVAAVTVIGALAAFALARYKFPGNRIVYFLLFSSIILPPQTTIIGVFQLMVDYGLFNTLTGLILIYIAMQLPLTVYILETFFARLPNDLFDAARIDGYSELGVFWRIAFPIALPAVVTTIIINLVYLWNEFLFAVVLITDDDKRTLPLGIQKFMGDQLEDIGMIATGLMIAIVPIVAFYVVFSERIISGMTSGAVK